MADQILELDRWMAHAEDAERCLGSIEPACLLASDLQIVLLEEPIQSATPPLGVLGEEQGAHLALFPIEDAAEIEECALDVDLEESEEMGGTRQQNVHREHPTM